MTRLSIDYLRGKWLHGGFQRYFRNTGWMFITRILSMAISFLATIFIARKLGPMNYGQLSYALSFVSIFGFIASLGIEQVLYRDILKFPELKEKYLGSTFVIKIVAAIVALVLCLIFALIWSPRDVSFFLIFIIGLTFIFNPFQIISYEFQADVKSKYPSLVSLVVVFALNILKILVIFYGKGVIYLALIVLLEPILYAIGYIYYRVIFYGSFRSWVFDKQIAISILKDSSPLIATSAFATIYARIDQVMIKNMIDTYSVGLYDAAVRLSEVWYFIPNVIGASLFPAIMNARRVSKELYRSRLLKLTGLLFVVSAITSILTFIFSDHIVLFIFGSAFIGSILILKIYVLSNISSALNYVMNNYFIAENYRKLIFISSFVGMAANVILNLILIPKFGMVGAAWATLISYSLPITSVFFVKKTRDFILNKKDVI